MKSQFIFHRVRKSTRADNEIVIQGYCSQEFLESYDIAVEYKQENQALGLKHELMVGGMPAFARLEVGDINICHMISLAVRLPLKRMNGGYVSIVATSSQHSIDIWKGNLRDIYKALRAINLQVNSVIADEEEIIIKGWALDNKDLEIIALGGSKQGAEISDAAIERAHRPDVVNQYPEYQGDHNVGFIMYCPRESKRIYLQASTKDGRRQVTRRILWLEGDAELSLKTKLKKSYVKLHDYSQNMGTAATVRKLKKKVSSLTKGRPIDYDAWIREDVRERLARLDYTNQSLPEGYVLLTEGGTRLTRDAMYTFSRMIELEDYDIVYSDHDQYQTIDGKIRYMNPSFKPDYNIDLLRGYNYIGETFVVSKSFLEENNLQDKTKTPVDKHHILLMAYEKGARVGHVAQVLYHQEKDCRTRNPYHREGGLKMLNAHYERMGMAAQATINPNAENVAQALDTAYYQTTYEVNGNPKISIIIPNKDHVEDLKACIGSIERTDYKNYEIIIVENNSSEDKTFQYYKSLEGRQDIKVVYWDKEFNYSAINNFGVSQATGEYILLLNNDTELMNPDCLTQLLGCCQREDVGAVGARLYYEDGTIQHAGVIIGMGGIAGHVFTGLDEKTQIHQARTLVPCDYNAVTAACLMVSKEDYQRVGGLDEEFKVAFNDIDFCLKIRDLDKLIVYNSEVRLYHYESKSRGSEDTPERMDRFMSEIERFMGKWQDIIGSGDPYYNRNLSLDRTNYEIKG